jgi:hypothetical protein
MLHANMPQANGAVQEGRGATSAVIAAGFGGPNADADIAPAAVGDCC